MEDKNSKYLTQLWQLFFPHFMNQKMSLWDKIKIYFKAKSLQSKIVRDIKLMAKIDSDFINEMASFINMSSTMINVLRTVSIHETPLCSAVFATEHSECGFQIYKLRTAVEFIRQDIGEIISFSFANDSDKSIDVMVKGFRGNTNEKYSFCTARHGYVNPGTILPIRDHVRTMYTFKSHSIDVINNITRSHIKMLFKRKDDKR